MLGACGLNRIPCWDDTPMPMSSSIILWCWYNTGAPRVCFDIGSSAEQTVASASQSPTTADTLVQ